MSLTCCIHIMENKSHGTVSIVVDTVNNTLRYSLCLHFTWIELLSLILVVLYCTELVSIVALCISVSSSYNKGDLGHRSLAATEVLADRRLHLELPVVISNLCEVGLLLSCAPFSRNKLPLTVNYDSKVSIKLTCIAIERVSSLRLEYDCTWLVSVRICRIY